MLIIRVLKRLKMHLKTRFYQNYKYNIALLNWQFNITPRNIFKVD